MSHSFRNLAVTSFFLGTAVLLPGQSLRPGLGSIPYADAAGTGVTFRVWAPNATAVGVKGQFNGWSATPLIKDASGGLWSRDIAGYLEGQEYKYVINNSLDRRDPRARRETHSTGNSVVYNSGVFSWNGDNFTPPALKDVVLYEMHVGTFNAENGIPGSFDEAIDRLDHLRDLGVNAVEVMPVSEYAGDQSWGYNPADPYAVESSLGGPDAFKRFVKACHQRGLAVLVDVVHNHYGPSDLSLWQFDGWSQNGLGGIYFYNTAARASTSWGNTRPDYSRPEVRAFIRDQVFMLLDEYHVDGFRWDSVFSILYYNSGTSFLPEAEAMLSDINDEIESVHPGTIRIAEDHGFDFAMNFHADWDVGFHHHLLWQVTQTSDANRNMNSLADYIESGAGLTRVIFSESHDEVSDLNEKVRLPRSIDSGNPASLFARKRELLAASMALTAPGIPMLFQGQEMNEDYTFSSATPLRWELTNTFRGIVHAYSDLIHLRRNFGNATAGLRGTGVVVHHQDNVNKVISYVRWDAGGQTDDVVVVANFSVNAKTNNNYFVGFPSAGIWYVHFNGDDQTYGADFGGVGDDFLVATGSPAQAPVNIGGYSTLILSKTPPPKAGIVTLNPAQPVGCVEVVISYETDDGPLNGSTQVVASIGHNGWQNSGELSLTQALPNVWEAIYQLPDQTEILDLAFRSGEAIQPVWDNNKGLDWHFNVVDCAHIPAKITASPAQPQGCIPVTISYEERSGVLTNATGVNLYLGRNDWRNIASHTMVEGPDGVWTYTHSIPSDTWQLDFVFNGMSGINEVWDNNSGQDWVLFVSDCVDTLAPSVVVTNPAGDLVVSDTVSNVTLYGKTTGPIVGDLNWSNQLIGASGEVPAGTVWSIPDLELAEGVNLIRVSVTNSNVNPNNGAQDSATNGIYTAGPAWTNGQNGGNQWGGGWELGSGANSGHFVADSVNHPNLNIGTHAWGLWANSGSLAEAVRPMAGRMNTGDVLRLNLENSYIDGGSIGFGLQNRFGQNLFEFLFIGGDTNYLVNDSAVARPTGLPWTDGGVTILFELTQPTEYRLEANSVVITGALASAAEVVIDRFRTWNYSAGGGLDHNLYVDNLRMEGPPLEAGTFSDEIAITRPFGPNSDGDGDGFVTWEEEFAGTDPMNAASHFPDVQAFDGGEVSQIEIPSTVPARWYDIYASTDLVAGAWTRMGNEQQGSGGPLLLVVTNEPGAAFYRTGVFQP